MMRRNLLLPAVVVLLAATAAVPVTNAQPNPSVNTVTPNSALVGSGPISLGVYGANFVAGSSVLWNGISLITTYQSASQLTAQLSAAQLASPGTSLVVVQNPGGLSSNAVLFTVAAPLLTITTRSLPNAAVGSAYSAALAASGGRPPYLWGLASGNLPAGIALDFQGNLTGTASTTGAYPLTFMVTDQNQRTATFALQLTVNNPPLSVSPSGALPNGTVSQPYRQALTAVGGAAPFQWSLTGNVPQGLQIDGATGVIGGTPTSAGSFSLNVRVADAVGTTVTVALSLRVNAAPLSITTGALFGATVGISYAQTFSGAGGVAPYTWVLLGSAGPLSLDSTTGVLSGTPQTAGTLSFTILVQDTTGASVSQAFTLPVDVPKLTILNGSALPSAAAGVAYSQRLSVVGGTPPYVWSLAAGLPAGLALDASTGTLAGTPTSSGASSFTVQVRDSAGASTSKAFSLVTDPGALTLNPPTQLPGAMVTSPFAYSLGASGGAPPYNWTANGLPDGLQIDAFTGRIAGSPTTPGDFAFTVKVTDSKRATAVNLYRVAVGLPSIPDFSISGLPASLKPADQPRIALQLSSAYGSPLSGQLLLSFAADSGPGDDTIQFTTGGRSVPFTVPAGATDLVLPPSLAIQTGTVAGVIQLTVRLQAYGADVTPNPAPVFSSRLDRAAPVLTAAKLTRTATGLNVQVTGYVTAREVTQAVFSFKASTGNTLQSSQVTVALSDAFSQWFQTPANSRFGSQFVFNQPFTVQGDTGAVLPDSLTFTNRVGSVTIPMTQ